MDVHWMVPRRKKTCPLEDHFYRLSVVQYGHLRPVGGERRYVAGIPCEVEEIQWLRWEVLSVNTSQIPAITYMVRKL